MTKIKVTSILRLLTDLNENIFYASFIMSPEKYKLLESVIVNKDMSLKRIHAIERKLEIEQIRNIPLYVLANDEIAMVQIQNYLIILMWDCLRKYSSND